jgi:hypothetical protein
MDILDLFDKIDVSKLGLITNQESSISNNILCSSNLNNISTADLDADMAIIGV